MTSIATSDIVAQAFRFMERLPPASFDDATEEARAATEQYPVAMGHCLARADWSFASTRAQLSAEVEAWPDPVLPWLYKLPPDCLQPREVGEDRTRWRVDRDGLRADAAAPLTIRYTARLTDETRLPDLFQTAVALRLAWLLAARFLETSTKIERLDAQWRDTIKQAARDDARAASNARYDDLPEQPDWATEIRA